MYDNEQNTSGGNHDSENPLVKNDRSKNSRGFNKKHDEQKPFRTRDDPLIKSMIIQSSYEDERVNDPMTVSNGSNIPGLNNCEQIGHVRS